MKKGIYIKQWLTLKPYDTQVPTDVYYVRLANNIKAAISDDKLDALREYLSEDEIDLLCCFLSSYFEDIISETNLWNAFLKGHSDLYGKKLPFYSTEDYYENEMNEQDIAFLVWYFLGTIQKDKFINPYNDLFYEIAFDVMTVFEDSFEYAPENEHLKLFYQLDPEEDNYYLVRGVIDQILFGSYLFYTDSSMGIQVGEMEIIETGDENTVFYLREHRDDFLNKHCTRLLSMRGKEWAAAVLGEDHPLAQDILNMSQRVKGFFFYKGQDEHDVHLEHIASGRSFKLAKKSFDHSDQLKEVDSIIYVGLVRWKDEWWFSGIHVLMDFDADRVLDEKNSMTSRMEVNFLDQQDTNINEILKEQSDAFLSFNNGSCIAFMEAKKIEGFCNTYYDHYNGTLNLSDKERSEANERARKDGFLRDENTIKDGFSDRDEPGLVFFNSCTGIEVAFGINSAFPMKENPFFDEEESQDAVMHLLLSKDFSKELCLFCIDNCKDRLTFFKEGMGSVFLEDFDFLLRFWKNDNYHATPSITLTGKEYA